MFTLIFGGAFVTGWLVCGFVPWLVLSVATRGEAGLGQLPLCLFAGLVAGLAVPVLGMDGVGGFWFSFVAASVAPVFLLGARRLGAGAQLHARPMRRPSSRPE